MLCLNVSAGIGVLGMASPMLQEIFGGKLIGHPELGFTALSDDQKVAIAAIAAGFVGLLSLFNIGGRFFWASLSDHIGRKNTYFTFFVLGIALYASAPCFGADRQQAACSCGAFCIILSMYGGGFATVPAYLADMFGTHFVGAIHGRLLTAWSTAGIFGPVLVNYIREAQHRRRRAARHALQLSRCTSWRAAGRRLHLQPADQGGEPEVVHEPRTRARQLAGGQRRKRGRARRPARSASATGGLGRQAAALFWGFVGIPLAWGVAQTIANAMKLFQ